MHELAKSAEQVKNVMFPSQSSPSPQISVAAIDGVPLEMYRFFNINPAENNRDNVKYLKEIHSWAAKDTDNRVGDTFAKIRILENKLGVPRIGETRQTKMYNWIRVSNIINDLRGEREQQVKTVSNRRTAQMAEADRVREQEVKRIKKLKEKEEKELRQIHQGEIKQFSKLRKAYEV